MGYLNQLAARIVTLTLLSIISSPCFPQGEDANTYERSSIHIMMIKHQNQRFDDIIEQVFLQTPFPERFNNHNLGVKVVSFAEHKDDQTANIQSFVDQVNLGQKMVAKWFNRDKLTGSFNMELIKERGLYNATQQQTNVARASIRGMALLEDAGEQLIHNTYLVVNDISYRSKGSGNWFLKSITSVYAGNVNQVQKAMESIGGFNVHVTTYLFRLKWNDDIANTFYKNYYTEHGDTDKNKVEAFKKDNQLLKMEFVGKTEAKSNETNFKDCKDPQALLVKVTTRTMDHNLASLQQIYPDFRIKAPLLSIKPLTADVGLKEDVTEDTRFEVLERVIDEHGKMSYVQVGLIKPVAGKIKDNRYKAEEDAESILKATEFEKISGKDFYPGMLIREKKE